MTLVWPGKFLACFVLLLLGPQYAVVAEETVTLVSEDRSVLSIDERPIRFYIDRPEIDERMPLLVVIDGSGCVGQKRPSSWGNFAPTPGDTARYARLMVEKPGVEPEAASFDENCTAEFHKNYTVQNRVLDHLRVLQHLEGQADWWNGDILLWGWSDGGDVAAQIVTYRPDIKRAVLGAMGGGLTMAEHFERFWACPPGGDGDRSECLTDLHHDFAEIYRNPSGELMWNGESYATWASRLRSRLIAPLADNKVPLLIVHGELDSENTPVESARALVEGLHKAGNRSFTYWEIPGMGHGWQSLPEDRQLAIRTAMLDWLLAGQVNPDLKAKVLSR